MNEKTREAWNFVLGDGNIGGLFGRTPEGKADHIVVSPEAAKFFEEIYDDFMAGSSPLIVALK